ncbi:hypothetical protein ACH42_06930 [Endozoicomonas sp. (ex Bugula neritina AB1)]|nr:hypothetical protein ACH42_06930 [Endozoicomonas sp. (ex Bugula neritina AB1)]
MSSKVEFTVANYTTDELMTHISSQTHLENSGEEINGKLLLPLDKGDTDNIPGATITVTTGDHDGSVTLDFLVPSQSNQKVATLRCTDLKNPENDGVLIPTTNAGYTLDAVGFRDVNDKRLITITLNYQEPDS